MPGRNILLTLLFAAMAAIGGAALLAQMPWQDEKPPQQIAERADKESPSGEPADEGGETVVAATPQAGKQTADESPGGLTIVVPQLGEGMADVGGDPLGFDVVRVEPTGEALFAGRAHPNAAVEIVSNGSVIANAVADPSGAFVVMPDKPLKPGGHDLSLRLAGEDGAEAEQRVAVVVPERAEDEVLVVAETPGEPSEVLAKPNAAAGGAPATSGGDEPEAFASAAGTLPPSTSETAPGASEAKGTQASSSPAGEEQELAVEAVEEETGTMYVAGAGQPGTTVRVYVDEVPLGEAKVNEAGRWIVQSPRKVEEGEVAVRADQLDASGERVAARSEVAFSREANEAVLVPVAGEGSISASGTIAPPRAIIIRRGDNLWTLSRRNYGRGIRYTTIYTANQGQIRDPDLIYPGQVFTLPTRDKNWQEEAGG